MQNLLRPQTYPYASSSIGPYRGLLAQKYPCWDAQGPARDKFENRIVGEIKDCLEQCLLESNSFVGFSLFMVGKAPEKTKPTVMIVSDDKARRKAAFQMVKSRSILSSYPGFELGHCSVAAEFEDLQRLGRDTTPSASATTDLVSTTVYAFEYPGDTKATRLYFHTPPDSQSHNSASATCNELFSFDGELYALTMAHAIRPSNHADTNSKQRDTDSNSSSDSDDCEITGMEDWDEDDTNALTTITSQGSKTSSEDSGSENSLPSVPNPPRSRYSSNSSSIESAATYSSSNITYGSSRGTSVLSGSNSVSSVITCTSYPDIGASNPGTYRVLPCEFVDYSGCEMTFDVNDVSNWIEHIVSEHLNDKLPKKANCWFCDDIEFDSKRVGDRRLNFEQRMWHIRDHIIEEDRTTNSIRLDPYFYTHLFDNGLIGKDVYNLIHTYSEVPVPPHILDSNIMSQDWGEGGSRSQMAYTDTRQDRAYRRRRRRYKNTGLKIGSTSATSSTIYKGAGAVHASERTKVLPQECELMGSVVAVDMEMDIAIIKLDSRKYGNSPPSAHSLPNALSNGRIFSDDLADPSITVKTTHGDINGQRSQMPFYTRLPGTRNFLELHSVKLSTSLRPGDSGSCAYDSQGAIVSFVLAGNPNAMSCMLLPAKSAMRSALSLIRDPDHQQPDIPVREKK